jgi:Mg-chelatase subunit ChlI
MHREVNGLIFCILIYVDDLLIFASNLEVEALRKLLTDRFNTITMEVVNSLS